MLTRHEVFAAQPAREMLSDGHWIVPTIAGEYRVNKPPTMGWLIAACMAVFRSEAEWVARLPAVLSGVGVAVVIASLTARFLGREAGVLAGLLTATSHYVLLQARLSEADMPMAFCVTLAFWVLAPFPTPPLDAEVRPAPDFDAAARPGSWHTLASMAFHAATGASFLLKGVGIAFVLPAAVAYALIARDRRAGRILYNPVGLLVLAAFLLIWPIAAYQTHPEIAGAWHREVVQRISGELREQLKKEDAWYYYGWAIPVMLLPWFPLVIVGAIAGIRRRWHRHRFGLLLLAWFTGGFVVLHLSDWKHKHYCISILPACAPAAAAGLIVWIRHNYDLKRQHPWIAGGLWTLALVTTTVLVTMTKPAGWPDIAVLLAILWAGGCVVIALEHHRKRTLQIAATFALAWIVAAGVFWRVSPLHDGYRATAELAKRINQKTPADATITLVDLGEHAITYYVQRRMERIDDPAQARLRLAQADAPRPRFIVAPAAFRDELPPAAGKIVPLDELDQLGRRQKPADREVFFRLE